MNFFLNGAASLRNNSEEKHSKNVDFNLWGNTHIIYSTIFSIFSPLWHPSFSRITAKSQISQRFHLDWVVIPGNGPFLNFDRVWRLIFQYKQPKFGQLWAARGLSEPSIEKKWIHRNHYQSNICCWSGKCLSKFQPFPEQAKQWVSLNLENILQI